MSVTTNPKNSIAPYKISTDYKSVRDPFGGMRMLSELFTLKRIGLSTTRALPANTFMAFLEEFAIPLDIVQVQIGFENSSPTATPQIRCSVGFSEVASNPAQPLNTLTIGGVTSNASELWKEQSINGNSKPSLQTHAGVTPNKQYVTWFDPYPVPSLPRTEAGRKYRVMKVIAEFAGWHSGVPTNTEYTAQLASVGITGWEQDTDLSLPPYGNFWRTRSQAVAGALSPISMTSTVADNSLANLHAPIIVRLWPKSGKCFQVVIGPGDSNIEASGDTLDKYGAVYRSLHKLQSMEFPIGICNIAQAGSSPSNWRDMASVYLPLVPNSLVVTPNMSPNIGVPLGDTVQAVTIVDRGTGGTPGAVTLTGTTGTGTKFQVAGVIGADGKLASTGAITVTGPYTILPAVIGMEPVTGGNLVGAKLSLTFIGTNQTLGLRSVSAVKSIADRYGCGVVTVTCLAADTLGKDWKGSDPMRLAINEATRKSNEPYIDYAAVLAGEVVGNQVQYKVGRTTDKLHPNPLGHTEGADQAFTPFFKLFVGK